MVLPKETGCSALMAVVQATPGVRGASICKRMLLLILLFIQLSRASSKVAGV
ncbi:hypothetical protein CSB93_3999 [Pseudomonas paraeruginosa]|uniref:Uncharacterized protein n=1 Tax=Pseudomonas paraeruginosa TaxID=2994495 RepID=A0A2R3IPT9_9PSED|nr:hypothetical protein CSB93_3999 [Pseudomonas paraeruginosa]AWE92868.1 hypothetical protein CSC28_2782 [Pseudomonas paraeruginosa]